LVAKNKWCQVRKKLAPNFFCSENYPGKKSMPGPQKKGHRISGTESPPPFLVGDSFGGKPLIEFGAALNKIKII